MHGDTGTIAVSGQGEGDVSYESTDTDVATIDENGNIMIVGVGTFKITATMEADTFYEEATVTSAQISAYGNIAAADVSAIPDETYDGTAKTPTFTVTYANRALQKAIDYIVAYSSNIEVGSASVTITGMGLYTGSKTVTFNIVNPEVDTGIYYVLTVSGGAGSGSYKAGDNVLVTAADAPQGKVFDKWVSSNGGTFASDTSAATTFTMPAGDVTVTATYKDVVQPVQQVDDTSIDISGAVVKISDRQWTGKNITSGFVVSVVSGGNTYKLDAADYTIAKAGKWYKNIGAAKVTVNAMGDRFKGSKTVSFKIVPKKTSISKVTAGKKLLKIKLKKVSKAQKVTGYVVKYRYKNGSKWTAWKTKTVKLSYKKSGSTYTYSLKKLKKGKTYEVQVAAYKTVSGKKYIAPLSGSKSKKTK
jgi:hypothetical protein